jgi:hypothetical protein
MSLREKIEDNLTIWLLTMLVTGFVAGIATYKAILEIAQLEVVPKAKAEQLRASQSPTPRDILKPEDDPVFEDETPTTPPVVPPSIHFSDELPPFPEHLDLIRPGMRMSEAKAVLPHGTLSSGWYGVDLASGPFRNIGFFEESPGEDPVIGFIAFYFRDEDSRRAVLSAALRDFGGITHRSESLGTTLIWPSVNEFKLRIDESSYQIQASSKLRAQE